MPPSISIVREVALDVSVFENIDGVTTFARNALINASGKVYSDLASFKKNGAAYIATELAG